MISIFVGDIDPNARFTVSQASSSSSSLTCPHCGKNHPTLDWHLVEAGTYESTCPETGETIRLRLSAERKRPGPSEVK